MRNGLTSQHTRPAGRHGRSRATARLPGLALAALAAFAALATLPGCSEELPPHGRPVARVLVVGIDGLEWSVLRPLLAAGRCPNLRGLMERGSFGHLATLSPTLSPVIWTTIATGRLPQDHGIRDFVDARGDVYTSSQRAVRALWNIADRYGLTTNCVGWWDTYPAERVAGVMVAGCSSPAMVSQNWKPALLPDVEGQVHPVVLSDEILALAEQAGSLERVRALSRDKVFGQIPAGVLDRTTERLVQQSLWSLQADATFAAIAQHLLATRPADLNLVYLASPDVISHRFWRQYEPAAYAWHGTAAADAALAHVIPDDYAWVDELLGALLAAAGPETTVIVLSDHGFHAVAKDHAPDPADERPLTGHHDDAPPGVIVAAGPGIVRQGGLDEFLKSGVLPLHGSVLDVAPTVLALLGIPGARNMPGRAYTPVLADGPALQAARLPLVDTHDHGFRPPKIEPVPREIEQSFRERFEALGYIHVPRKATVAPGSVPVVAPDGPPADAPPRDH